MNWRCLFGVDCKLGHIGYIPKIHQQLNGKTKNQYDCNTDSRRAYDDNILSVFSVSDKVNVTIISTPYGQVIEFVKLVKVELVIHG